MKRILFFIVFTSVLKPLFAQPCSTPTNTSTALPRMATGSESCTFPSTFRTDSVVALSNDLFQLAGTCGQCIEVVGPLGTVDVMVDGECTACPFNSIDISMTHFNQIADISGPNPTVSWRIKECPVVGNIVIEVAPMSNQWYLDLLVYNTRYPLQSLELWDGSVYVPIERSTWNHFDSSFLVPSTLQIRLTDIFGHQVVETVPFAIGGGTYIGTSQFSMCSSLMLDEKAPMVCFDIFPNPANGFFMVKLLDQTAISLSLTDNIGREVLFYEGTFQHQEFSLHGVEPGLYTVKVQTMKGFASKMVVVL